MKPVTIRYFFTSTRADGDGYTRDRVVKARDHRAALQIARAIGFREFGAKFTDWQVVNA
jgi:hypothetical protein